MRNALYQPNTEARQNEEKETSVALNWFFNGHKNKLTFETSYFNYVKSILILLMNGDSDSSGIFPCEFAT